VSAASALIGRVLAANLKSARSVSASVERARFVWGPWIDKCVRRRAPPFVWMGGKARGATSARNR
jgi:hypothetical protein